MEFTHHAVAPHFDVVLESHPEFHSVCVGLWVCSGSQDELKPTQHGYSHFVEHMVFKGTRTRSPLQIAEELEARGGDLNAFTDREFTCYHATVLKRDLVLALDLLSDIVFDCTFPAVEIKRERGVILQEIAMVEDDPEEWVHDLFYELCWQGHSTAHTILGTTRAIESASRAKLIDWHHQSLKSKPLILSVAGPVADRELMEALKLHVLPRYQTLMKHIGEPHRTDPVGAAHFQAGTYFAEKDLEQTQVVVGYPGLPFVNEDRYALFLLNTFLGGGMSSTLFQTIREKLGLAYSVYSSVSSLSQQGVFDIYVGTSPKYVSKVLDVLKKEADRLVKRPLSDKLLRVVKDKFIGALWLNADQMESRMNSIAKNQFVFQKYVPISEVARGIEQVSAEDIQRVARETLASKEICTVILGQKGSVKGLKGVVRL